MTTTYAPDNIGCTEVARRGVAIVQQIVRVNGKKANALRENTDDSLCGLKVFASTFNLSCTLALIVIPNRDFRDSYS